MTKEQVLEKLKFDVELRWLSKNTQDEYYTKAKIFQDYLDKPATELHERDIREFLHYLSVVSISFNDSAKRSIFDGISINSPLEKFNAVVIGLQIRLRNQKKYRYRLHKAKNQR